MQKDNAKVGVQKTIEVSDKKAKNEETSPKDSPNKIESLKKDGLTKKKEAANKENIKKTASPSSEDKK